MITNRITIIGLGLIGGSLGLAIKKARGTDIEIIGCARRDEVGKQAVERGAIDIAQPDIEKAINGTDIVVIATPITAIKNIFQKIADHVSLNTVVTDVGSTKVQVMEWAQQYLPQEVSFVGGHPMTGKETAGIEEAEGGLFEGSAYCLVPSTTSSPDALLAVQELVGWIGGMPLLIESELHDDLVAGISHLPLVLSSTLVATLAESNKWADMAKLAASGYHDSTRLASGDDEIQMSICATNRHLISEWIDRYIENLAKSRDYIMQADDTKLRQFFHQARKVRENWLENEGSRFRK